jgi:hypothetical protein
VKLVESEYGFMGWVIDYAHYRHWTVAHFRPARTGDGWATAVQADGAGFPDLVLVRDRVVFAELKAGRRPILSPAQDRWLDALTTADAETYVWVPADRPDITRILA